MLFYVLVGMTLIILLGAMWYAYSTTRDPLHPLVYLAPLCIYSYAFKPALLAYLDSTSVFFDNRQMSFVLVVNAIGVGAFCLGALYHANHVTRLRVGALRMRAELQRMLTPAVRRRVLEIAWVIGGLAVGTFWILVASAGGLGVVYGQIKGGVRSGTGYVNEVPLLCLSAIGLLYLAWAGQRFTLGRILALLVAASPLLVHGLLGARRGPTFMVLGALVIGAFLVAPRRPKLVTVFGTVFFLGFLILFLVNNRERIYLGSGALEEWSSGSSRNMMQSVSAGDDWVYSGGAILVSNDTGRHFWGGRLLVNLLIRPIPRQLWENKYIDTGFGWMDGQEDMSGMADNEWIGVVGWRPPRGAAAGFVADLFLEFSYFSFVACYAFGWLYSYLWKQSVLERGSWLLLYLFAVILSVYVPTQSISAWCFRFVFLALPTLVLWGIAVQPVIDSPGTESPGATISRRPRRPRIARPNLPPDGRLTAP